MSKINFPTLPLMSIRSSISKILCRQILVAIFFAAVALFLFYFWTAGSSVVYENRPNFGGVPPPPPPPPSHISTPEPVKGIYMTSWVAGTPSLRNALIDFIEHSEINSIVIDIKDYSGKVAFKTMDPVVGEMQSEEERIPDIRELIDELHQKNIYVIGRITVFQDPFAARRHPELAVGDSRGGVWRDRKGLAYIDPGAEKFWDYIVHVSEASERVGFDELNFDYIRYPSDGLLRYAVYPFAKGRTKEEVLESFFIYLRKKLPATKVPISADLFGLTTWNEDDLNIGQVLEKTVPYFDYIAPMVYPSHYANGFGGFKNPAAYPYEVVHMSMARAVERLKKMGEDPQKLRPWIQDFDLGAPYGIPEVLAEKKAVQDAGLESWMAWDAANIYTKEAYPTE
ncbi:MAG: hypothetical protein HYT34_00010 [Candidatus Ryanbacteria bacterium]|nr:hypothetical protein [Candidatus Ryanbacteria bacterium]